MIISRLPQTVASDAIAASLARYHAPHGEHAPLPPHRLDAIARAVVAHSPYPIDSSAHATLLACLADAALVFTNVAAVSLVLFTLTECRELLAGGRDVQ